MYLEAFVGNCPTRVVRSKKPPDEVSIQSSGKALREQDSGHGPIHREPWLLSLQCMDELALEKALGDIFPPFHCVCSGSCCGQALCLLVARETVSSRKLQKYFMKCSNKNIHVVRPMQNNMLGWKCCVQFL